MLLGIVSAKYWTALFKSLDAVRSEVFILCARVVISNPSIKVYSITRRIFFGAYSIMRSARTFKLCICQILYVWSITRCMTESVSSYPFQLFWARRFVYLHSASIRVSRRGRACKIARARFFLSIFFPMARNIAWQKC